MSYFQKQVDAFKSDLASSSTKLANKRTAAAPRTAAPSPAPSVASQPPPPPPSSLSTTAAASERKRKRPDAAANVVYSQPADTGTGRNIMTQVSYAVDYLKSKDAPQNLAQIVSYLSLHSDDSRQTIAHILKQHERVEHIADKASRRWDAGTYRFRPLHDIRSADDLLRFLQKRATAQGLSVKELKDGWPGAEEAIDLLEKRNQILVTRNKKDNHAKMVWANDASLMQKVDPQFQTLWFKATLPSKEDLPRELDKLGLKPTSTDPSTRVVAPLATKQKKQKKPRKGGRTTNTHMTDILRDYSSLKK
jgi:transcription initiation factor TFIIE subunit beta